MCGGENWLSIVLVLSVKKSGKVVSCYRSGGRWWRGTEERIYNTFIINCFICIIVNCKHCY